MARTVLARDTILAVMIKKQLQRRREKEYVKRILAVGAGLNVVEPAAPPIKYGLSLDALWTTAAVLAPIFFALIVIARIFL